MQQVVRPIILPAYKEHNRIQNYIAILEDALESRNREISALRAALKREKDENASVVERKQETPKGNCHMLRTKSSS